MRYRDYLVDILDGYRVFWETPDVGIQYPFIVCQGTLNIAGQVWSGNIDLNLWHSENPDDIIDDLMKLQNFKKTYSSSNWVHGSIVSVGDTIATEEDVTNTLIRLYMKGV